MTEKQRNETVRLGRFGMTYQEIGSRLGVTQASVKQFFYRSRKNRSKPIRCEQCHSLITAKANRQRRFCSDTCRWTWWDKHPEAHTNSDDYHYVCRTCGKSFYARRLRFYCSRDCYYISMRNKAANHD